MVARLILASASPARLATLRSAGLSPEVLVSGVDETAVTAGAVPALVSRLARLKAEAAATRLDRDQQTTIVLGNEHQSRDGAFVNGVMFHAEQSVSVPGNSWITSRDPSRREG